MLILEQLAREVVANWATGDLAGTVRHLSEYLDGLRQERMNHENTIEAARSNYAEPSDNDIEIGDVPLLSVAEDGVWVSAWVLVPIENEKEES